MALLGILTYPDPRLLKPSGLVESFDAELHQLLDDMAETMYQAPGIGLAAPQVNVHRRLIVVDVSETRDTLQEFINPELVTAEGSQECEEGCLSVPGVFANVIRAEHIRVRALDRHGKVFEHEASGIEAVCIQHEIDHLDGKVFVDYLSPLKRERIRKKLHKQARQSM